MKKLMLLSAILMMAAGVFAQKPGLTPEEKALLITNKMKEDQLISESDFDKVYQINLQTAEEKAAKMEKFREEQKKFREELRQVDEQRLKKYESVLSPDQVRNIKLAEAKRKAGKMRMRKERLNANNRNGKMHKKPFPPMKPEPTPPVAR